MNTVSSISELSWNRKCQTGDEKIDSEHKAIFDLIKRIDEEFENEEDQVVILRSLVELRKYADFHFHSEESFMLKIGYDGYTRHKALHEKLMENLDKWIFAYETGDVEILFIIGQLDRWFFQHTNNEDMKIQEFLSSQSE